MFVYALVDPRNDQVRYVGIAIDPVKRLAMHFTRTQREQNLAKGAWFDELEREGLKPKQVILEADVPPEKIYVRENYWIQFYLDAGALLTNIAIPGVPPQIKQGKATSKLTPRLSLPRKHFTARWAYTHREQKAILLSLNLKAINGLVTGKEAARILTWRAKQELDLEKTYKTNNVHQLGLSGYIDVYSSGRQGSASLYPVGQVFNLPLVIERKRKATPHEG